MRTIHQRLIKENHSVWAPARMLFLDTEAKKRVEQNEVHLRTKLAWTCYVNQRCINVDKREKWRFFTSTEKLNDYVQFLAFPSSPLWVFGHNLYYDLQASDFFYYFTKWGWELDFFYDNGLTYLLIIHKDKRSIKCVSTTNYFDCSLATLGEAAGLRKYTIDFDRVSDRLLSYYCKRDVEIMKRGVEMYMSFVKEHDLGKFAMTKASQAYSAFRHRFMTTKITTHDDYEIKALERASFFGGRTECFRFGYQPPGRYCILDVNSMYPWIMRNFKLPVRCADYRQGLDIGRARELLGKWGIVAEVELETEEPAYAVSQEGKIIFPTGRFETFVCSAGLKYAIERGHVKQIKRCAIYELDVVFRDYIDYFYNLKLKYRKEGNAVYERLCKTMMNSLYGKFGQKRPLEEKVPEPGGKLFWTLETLDPKAHRVIYEYKLFNTRVTRWGYEELSNNFIAIPAHITEYARFVLWGLINEIGRDRVYYCDTDSVIVKLDDVSKIRHRLDPEKLGYLKVESRFRKLALWGAKYYEADKDLTLKGVPRTAEQLDSTTWQYYEFERQATHMKRGVTRYYITREVIKKAPPLYDKGEINPDGTISPLRLSLPLPPSELPQRPSASSRPSREAETELF